MQSLGGVYSSSSSAGIPTTLFCLSCSTLDPVLRGEVHGFDWKVFVVLATASLYFFATPGEKHPSSNCTRAVCSWPHIVGDWVPAQQLPSCMADDQDVFCNSSHFASDSSSILSSVLACWGVRVLTAGSSTWQQ